MPIFVFNFPKSEIPEVKKQIKSQNYISPEELEAKKALLTDFEKTISAMKDANITSEQIMEIIKKYYNT